eukprot:Tbor_TRINITY_DN5649_c0_g6::TRINITY_DN5649_c0_g6_i1::g.8376::m.8376
MSQPEWLVKLDNRLSQKAERIFTTAGHSSAFQNDTSEDDISPLQPNSKKSSKDYKFQLQEGGNRHIMDKLQNLRRTLKERKDDEDQESARKTCCLQERIETIFKCYKKTQERIVVEANDQRAATDKLSNFITTTVESSIKCAEIDASGEELNKINDTLQLLSAKVGMLENTLSEHRSRSEASERQRQQESLSYKNKLADMYNLISQTTDDNIQSEALFAEEVLLHPFQDSMGELVIKSEERKKAFDLLRENIRFWGNGSAFQYHIRAKGGSKQELPYFDSIKASPTLLSPHRPSDQLTGPERSDIFAMIGLLSQAVTLEVDERTTNHKVLLDTVYAAKQKLLS